jgi:hypothetical protein
MIRPFVFTYSELTLKQSFRHIQKSLHGESFPSQGLTITQPVKKFPAFVWTRRLIAAYTRTRHWSLSWMRITKQKIRTYARTGLEATNAVYVLGYAATVVSVLVSKSVRRLRYVSLEFMTSNVGYARSVREVNICCLLWKAHLVSFLLYSWK